MPVEVELKAPGCVTADLQERFAPLGVIEIEIVVIGDNRFVAGELEDHSFAGQAPSAEGVGFLLSDSDEDHRVAHRSLRAQLMSPLVLGLFALEVKQRNILALSKGLDLGDELAGDMAEQCGRSDRIAPVHRQKAHEAGTMLQVWDIAVEVESVDGLQLQGDMVVEKITDVQWCSHAHRLPLVGLRSKTSLDNIGEKLVFLRRFSGDTEQIAQTDDKGGRVSRSVWSAWSLLPLSDVWRGSKAGASSTHSIRFARFGSGYAGLGTDAPYPLSLITCVQ